LPPAVWLFLGGLAANLLSGHSDLIGLPIPLDRLLMIAALGLLAIDPNLPRPRWRLVHTVMGVTILWTALSAMEHETLLDQVGLYALLDRIIMPCLLFSMAPLIFTSRLRRQRLLQLLSLIGLYLSLTAIFQIIGPHSLVFPRYILEQTAGTELENRASGPFVSSEANGMVMGIAAASAWQLIDGGRQRGIWRTIGLATLFLAPVGLLLTMTRSVWVGAALAFLAVGMLTPKIRRRLPAIILASVLAAGLAFSFVPGVSERLEERATTSRSLYDRANTNAAAMRILEEKPIEGIGWSRFLREGTDWVRQADTYPVTTVNIEVHNVFLSRAAETGVPGALLWIACIVLGPLAALRALRSQSTERRQWALTLSAALCLWFVPSMLSPNPYPLPNYLLWIIAGIVARPTLISRTATF